MNNLLYYQFGAGSGTLKRGIALAKAGLRSNSANVTVAHNFPQYSWIVDSHLPPDQHLSLPANNPEALQSVIDTGQHSAIITSSAIFPHIQATDTGDADTWLLLYDFPGSIDFMVKEGFDPKRWKGILIVEPSVGFAEALRQKFNIHVQELLAPVLATWHDEVLTAKDARTRLFEISGRYDQVPSMPILLVAQNGLGPDEFRELRATALNKWEMYKHPAFAKANGYHTNFFMSQNTGVDSVTRSSQNLAELLQAANLFAAGSGYNAFWEAVSFLREDAHALWMPQARPVDNQYRRALRYGDGYCKQVRNARQNGADHALETILSYLG